MKRSSIVLSLLTAFPLLLISSEPSAFGAGDLNNPEPYGLTSNEKVILETKQSLKKVAVKSNNQANELESLRERIDGFQSIIESLSRKAHNNKVTINRVLQSSSESALTKDEYEKRVSELVQNNIQSIEKLELLSTKISTLLDSINAEYVTKKELNAVVEDVNNFKALVVKELGSSSKKSSSLSNAEIFAKAKKDYTAKYYTKSIEGFEHLIKHNYKPAYSHYMIGEMNYYRKNYADAISYFKKSSALYSKASYMPTLMLHTAISMQKSGDQENAEMFYNAVISKYSDSKAASIARKKLN